MSTTLIVNNIPFEYPDAGEDPGWGEGATEWAQEVTNVLNSLLAPGDILETTFNIANNVTSPANVVGLFFDTANVRSADIQYSIYRVSTGAPSGNTETGFIQIVYDNSAGVGEKWSVAQQKTGECGVVFDISDSGQFSYTSSDIGAAGYSGIMKFNAKTTSI